ncbi:hypothetical protein GFU71_05435 [Campylobacter coli]|nr:hypothetical protein [Campylobacter coli]EAI7224541.1 hypothetical protein [Campylobacter coli]EDC4844993.1 hypothetical protein [Campylobacter coli]EDK0146600.1 hypothetical protein [Campylobacter coli]EIZ0997396.1 hypothetical protein [Campylobacter coli]
MDFFDSLKSIKKEMQTHSKEQKSSKNSNKDMNHFNKETKIQPQETILDKEMQEVFLKQEKLQDEFLEFIKNADIKKI